MHQLLELRLVPSSSASLHEHGRHGHGWLRESDRDGTVSQRLGASDDIFMALRRTLSAKAERGFAMQLGTVRFY